jgi:predicted nucleotidyltransferase
MNDYDILIISGLHDIDKLIVDRHRRQNTYFILDQTNALLFSAGPHLRLISRVARYARELRKKYFDRSTYFNKIAEFATICDAIIVGSAIQADIYSSYNKNVTIIPDILDEEYGGFCKRASKNDVCRLVWEGFAENVLHFDVIKKALKILSTKYSIELLVYSNEYIPKYFKYAGKVEKYLSTIPCSTEYSFWRKESIAEDLLKGDVGIIPIEMKNKFAAAKPDNKLNILRMMGLPVVATPTLAYKESIEDGLDGFLASTTKEWVSKIGRLIEDVNLRERIGLAGRLKALEKASFSRIWPQWIKVFSSLSGRKGLPFTTND